MSASHGTYKSRDLVYTKPDSLYEENLYGQRSSQRYSHSFIGGQQTWSQENPLFHLQKEMRSNREVNRDLQTREWLLGLDSGGDFMTVSYEYDDNVQPVALSFRDGSGAFLREYKYTGRLYPRYSSARAKSHIAWSAPDLVSTADMISKGTTAIARTIPTHPAVGVSTILGELRQGLPSIPGKAIVWDPVRKRGRSSRTRSRARKGSDVMKRGSSEFLNWTFAVAPAIGDVQDLAKSVMESERILSQLERDSGRRVRRRYSFPDQITNEVVSTAFNQYLAPAGYAGFYPRGGGTIVHRRKRTVRYWFSGAYSYYFQRGGDTTMGALRDAKNYAEHVLGLRIDPEMAWNLTPWSWLVDWKTNMGDVMTNISAFSRDDLVLRYGYIMRETRVIDSYTWSGFLSGAGNTSITQNFTTTVKKRVKATPYGFGLDSDWRSFTGRQVAILGALGITRAL